MKDWASGIYSGVVFHRRTRPRDHLLRYRVFMLLLDLDELPAIFTTLRRLKRGRSGWTSFDPADHGDGSPGQLKDAIQARLFEAGVIADGPVRLLCMPRMLGFGFNPLSIYFCHRRNGDLAGLVYEVSNTFGDRHSYVIPAPAAGTIRQTVDKRLHVSPFMDMNLRYAFAVEAPGDAVKVSIDVLDEEGPMLSAGFAGRRSELSDANLLRAWLGHPLLTLKVVAAIHWEALRIWLKGIGYRPRPPAPARAYSLGRLVTVGGNKTAKEKPPCEASSRSPSAPPSPRAGSPTQTPRSRANL